MKGQKPRVVAARILLEGEKRHLYAEHLLDRHFVQGGLTPSDRHLAQELVYGVIRWQRLLDGLIQRKLYGRAPTRIERLLLRIGLYQLFWLDRVPAYAAIDETVHAAKGLARQENEPRRINAILRSYHREAPQTRQWIEDQQETHPALGYSHPDWLWNRWCRRWGPELAKQLMVWNNTPPPTLVRRNSLRVTAEILQQQWDSEEVSWQPVECSWTGRDLVYQLQRHPPVQELPSFQSGWFFVQDPSTLLAPLEMQAEAGDQILDYCSAPGGKATFLAQLMGDRGRIVAYDRPERLPLIRENSKRMGLSSIEVLDSEEAVTASGSYDRILMDVPCSNTGVMRRRVDLRWRLRSTDMEQMGRQQVRMLVEAARRLKVGGTLVYSTCSLERCENQDVIRRFRQSFPNFHLIHERELLPMWHQTDGAYVARLVRVTL